MKETWVVAVSGGPDSMALLDKMRQSGTECIIAHVNYHMRDESDFDMHIVEEYAQKYDLPLVVEHYNPRNTQGNFQKVAREFRYNFFCKLVDKENARGILLAHHLDDDLETYLFQKERNMKSDSLGLSEISYYRDVVLKRPLLKFRKQELVDYCIEYNIAFAIDHSNSDTKYTRNRIRKDLSNLKKEEWDSLLATMYADKVKWKVYQNELDEVVSKWGETVNISDLETLNDPAAYLRRWMKNSGASVHTISENYLREITEAVLGNKGYFEFGEWVLEGAYGKVWFVKQVVTHDIYDEVSYGVFENYSFSKKGQRIESVNLEEKDFPIIVRNANSDDEIELRFGTKKINRFFIDRKIPKAKRKNTLVIENSLKQIVFIVGLGSDVHHYSNNPNLFVIKL